MSVITILQRRRKDGIICLMSNYEKLSYGPRPLNLSLWPLQDTIDRYLVAPGEERLYGISNMLVARLNEQLPVDDTKPLEPKGFAVALHNVLADCSFNKERLERDGTHDVPESLVGRVNVFNVDMIAYDALRVTAEAYGHGFACEVNDTFRITRTDDSSVPYLSDAHN